MSMDFKIKLNATYCKMSNKHIVFTHCNNNISVYCRCVVHTLSIGAAKNCFRICFENFNFKPKTRKRKGKNVFI